MGLITATAFMPERSGAFLADRLEAGRYEEEALVAQVKGVRLAAVCSPFTDAAALLPQAERQAYPHPAHETNTALPWHGQPGGVLLKLGRFWIFVHQSAKPSTAKTASASGVSDT